jgi:hypothetical protein
MNKFEKTKVVFYLLFAMTFLSVGYVRAEEPILRAGAARVDITPPVNPDYPPSGRFDHEKLFIRAIVIDNGITRAVLIGADINNIYEDSYVNAAPAIASELKCPVENILMSPTHTHSGRTAGPPPEGGKLHDTKLVAEAIILAAREANSKLRPARIGFGTGAAYLNVNRDVISQDTRLWTQAANPDGPSDKTLAVILITDLNGSPVAGYMNYPMHPVNGYLSGITSADFPGAACRYIEKSFGDNMVMIYSQGASGDQNPLWLRPGTNALASKSGIEITGYELVRETTEAPLREGRVPHGKLDPEVAFNLERWMDALGVLLGEETIRVMTSISNLSNEVNIWGKQEILTLPGRKRTNTGREGSPGEYEEGPDVKIRVGLLGIGDIALAGVNAEVYNIIAQKVKRLSPMSNTLMVSIANGKAESGYIIDDASYGRNTFQVLGNRVRPGFAEKEIVNTLTEIIREYDSKNIPEPKKSIVIETSDNKQTKNRK